MCPTQKWHQRALHQRGSTSPKPVYTAAKKRAIKEFNYLVQCTKVQRSGFSPNSSRYAGKPVMTYVNIDSSFELCFLYHL